MKLYVWQDVLYDYTPGIMFAIASSAEEARSLLLKECDYIPKEDLAKAPEELPLNTPCAYYVWGGS